MYVKLIVVNGPLEMEMEGAKTIKYAAKSVAEALGANEDEADWRLLDADAGIPIPEDDIAANWDGRQVALILMGLWQG